MDLNSFIGHSRKAILLVCIGLFIAGCVCVLQLPVAIFPDLNAPRIIVTADAGDTPIPTVLANVTLPIENALSGIPGVSRMGSLTVRGSDELDVNFAWGTDVVTALQLVNAKLADLQRTLPTGTVLTAERLNPSVFPIMGYSLYSKTESPETLRRLAQYTIRPCLLRIPGIQQVTVMGGDTPEYLVRVNPVALLQRGLSVTDIETALAKTNGISSVGYYDEQYQRHDILIDGLFKSAADIANVAAAQKDGIPVLVGQVADVFRTVETRTIETSGDGHDAVLVDILKQPSGNTVEIANGVSTALSALRNELPPDITISNYYDQSQIVRESQSSVLEAILIGGILALVVLMYFLGNLRAATVVLILLPLTVVITFVLMRLLGQTLNIMTLGALAIALGLVIDDGIVVVENIFHELENGHSRKDAIAAGLRAITPAMIGSSITTIAAFLPLTFLVDLTGQFFAPLAVVMISALAVSLTLALLVAPLLAAFLLPLKAPRHRDLSKAKTTTFYAAVLQSAIKYRKVTLALILPLVIISALVAANLKTGFFPEFDEGGFVLDYHLPDGTSLEESSAIAHNIEDILARTPEIAAWSRRTGAQLGFDITTQNVGDMSVRLNTQRSRTIEQVMESVRDQVNGKYPQAQADFHQILQDNIGDIAGSPSPVEIKIFGPNQKELEQLATQTDSIITTVPGVVDDFDGVVHSDPQTIVRVNSSAALRYGFTTDDVATTASAALLGDEPTHVQEGEEQVGVRVLLDHPSGPIQSSGIGYLQLASPVSGQTVTLSQLAEIEEVPGSSQITREDQRQMIAVTSDLQGRDLGSATTEIKSKLAEQLNLPPGYSVEYGGEYASQQQSFSELTGVLGATGILVFTLLVFQFRSIRQAFAVIVAAILSLSGVLIALLITGTPLNISSFTGAIMIIGIITENGIVLFGFFNQMRHKFPDKTNHELMSLAGAQRLRPILMTTVGAILALFPLALGIGAGAELQKPLAIAVIGGLCVSIVFTLVFAPVIFLSSSKND